MASSMQYVAEVNYSKTCFGLNPRHKPTLDVLDGASAATRVQEGHDVVLWLDLQAEAVFITERWGVDTIQRKLPLNLCIDRQQPTGHDVDEEVSVAAVEFRDRASAELFGKLALSVLPEWLAIRRSTGGKSLLVLADHWLISTAEQALKLQHPDGHLSGLLQLDLHRMVLELVLMQDGQACRSYQVSSLDDVSRLLRKHSKPRQRLDKVVHSVLQDLKANPTCVGRLLARLESTVMKHKGAVAMSDWCRGGIMAALVDCAASLGSSDASSSSSKAPQRQSAGGYHDHRQSHAKRSSMPGTFTQQPSSSSSSTARVAVLQALSECCSIVLQFAADSQQQAELLVGCVGRALEGSMPEAVCVLQLLRLVLWHTSAAGTATVCAHLHQACCDLRMLHKLQHCYSSAIPHAQQQQRPLQVGLLSHQLEGLNADGASEPSTPSGCRLGAPAGLFDQQPPAVEPGSCPDSPQLPHSPNVSQCRRHMLVPKLMLPVPVTPAPGSASRLSLESSRRTTPSNCTRSVVDKPAMSGREPAGTSFLKAVQQLGHSCGQSVMAADLAAFVTHKQLLGGVVAVEAALQHSRPVAMSTSSGGASNMETQPRLSFEQVARLAVPAQLQVELLECLLLLCKAPSSELLLPRSWEHLLLSPLLVPKAVWLQHGSTVSGVVAGRECALTDKAYGRIRTVTLQLIQHSSAMWHPCLSNGGSDQGFVPGGPSLHSAVLEQFKLNLVAASSVQSQELLLLLRDFLRASQQPQLADTACFMLGGVLAQLEHMLRGMRLEHWSMEAVAHMDSLVQLYAQLLGQVTSPAAASWLLSAFGVQVSSGRSTVALTAGGSSSDVSSPAQPIPVPADTLQLLLDYLQNFLPLMAAAVEQYATGPYPAPAVRVATPSSGSSRASQACGGSSSLSPSLVTALQRMNHPPSSGGVFVMQLNANCWMLLARLLLLASRQPALRAQQGAPQSPMCPRGFLSSSRSNAGQPHPPDAGGSRTPGAMASPKFASSPMGRASTLSAMRDAAERVAGSPTPQKRPSLPLLALPNSCSFSRTPSTSTLAAVDSNEPLGFLQAYCSVSSDASGPGRCSIWQLLVELLMVNSSMGQAAALQHLAYTHGNRLLLPLQQAVVEFLATALGMPDSYAFSKPQLAEFYVHHHFLHFTQHYHRLPTSPASAMLCRSHLEVLLALCRQTGGANQVRRRFLQLKVLEFLAREGSLEYMCLHNQLAISPGSSCCSTPLSTSRTVTSCRASARGITDPGSAAGPSTTPRGCNARGLPPIALGTLVTSSGGGPSREVSARGGPTSRLWVSSPGCQFSARSSQNTQRSWSAKLNCTDDGSKCVMQHPRSARGAKLPATAALLPPQSFELATFRAEGKDLLLTGTSGLLTGTSSLFTGGSSLLTGSSMQSGQHGATAAGRSTAGGSDAASGQEMGGKVKAAVQALESAAAAAVSMPIQPQPPKSAAPAASAGRRQPGHRRLVCADDYGNAGLSAAGTAGDAGKAALNQHSCPNKQQQQHTDEDAQQQSILASVPKLQLPCSSINQHVSAITGPGSSTSPAAQDVPVAWQRLGPDEALDAPAAGRYSSRAGSSPGNRQVGGVLCDPHEGDNSSDSDSSTTALSPRADLHGYEVPASVRSQRRIKQPELTGDASYDNIIIDEWERATGLEFQFDGLSSDDESAGSSSGSSSGGSTPRGDALGSPNLQNLAAAAAVSAGAGAAPANSSRSRTLLRPQTPELAVLAQPPSAAAAAHESTWSVPSLTLSSATAGLPGRWISSSGSVEDAAAADMTHFLGQADLGLKALAALDTHGTGTAPGFWLAADGNSCSPGASTAEEHPAASSNGAGTAAAPAATAAVVPSRVPKLNIGGLQSCSTANGSSVQLHTPAAAAAAGGSSSGRQPALTPGSYRPGWDLEEDFERLMEAGGWDDDSESCSDFCSTPGSAAASKPALQQPHMQDSLHLQPVPPLQQPPPQQQRRRPPHLRLPQQRQPLPEQQQLQPQQELAVPAATTPSASSPDTQAPMDVQGGKWRSPGRGKKQVVMGGAGRRVISGPQAHALADFECSETDEDGGFSSDSEPGSEGSLVEGDAADGRTSLSPTRAGVVIPRLNLPQLQQPSWHLPMSATVLPSCDSSDAGLSSTQRTATTTSASRGGSMSNLTVMPLTTTRSSCGGEDSGRSCSHNTAGPGPGSSRLAAGSARWSLGGGFGCKGGSQGVVAAVAAGNTDAVMCTPVAAAAAAAGGGGSPLDPSQAPYATHRAKCAMYIDPHLHVLCMELALHLLVTPTGQLDPVQLPHEPSDTSLQRKVLLLMEHLSHSANLDMTCTLAQRARAAIQQRRQQQQHPLPICATASSCGVQQAAHQQERHDIWDNPVAEGSSAQARRSQAATYHQLREACSAVRDGNTFIRPSWSGGGSSGSSALGNSVTSAADAAAGLAGSTLRLLKLLSLPVLDMSGLTVGGMINKGAFSEVLAATMQHPGGGQPMPVALKVMDCNEDDACSFERVYNEVASLEALRGQPAVVPLLEYGITSGISNGQRQWVLVFPRYTGSMREWRLKWRSKGLDTRDLPVYLRLFLQVARAVAVLHATNIVHFDIKGDNVLLQHGFNPANLLNGSGSCASAPSSSRASSRLSSSDVALADFGDALMLENAHASSQRHRGTELFSSPEMLLLHAGRQHVQHAQHDRRKHRGVHAAHDVWSLGCTLYELLTGMVLFEDEGVGRITSYSSSQSSGGGAHGLRSDARGWSVLNAREKAALQHHTGCIELMESMLVGEPNWRPSADQVVVKVQRLLAAVLSSPHA